MREFIRMERSYLEWAGNKITELNAEVRELKIKLEKCEAESEQFAWDYAASEKDSIDLRKELAEAQENIRILEDEFNVSPEWKEI